MDGEEEVFNCKPPAAIVNPFYSGQYQIEPLATEPLRDQRVNYNWRESNEKRTT